MTTYPQCGLTFTSKALQFHSAVHYPNYMYRLYTVIHHHDCFHQLLLHASFLQTSSNNLPK